MGKDIFQLQFTSPTINSELKIRRKTGKEKAESSDFRLIHMDSLTSNKTYSN